MKPGAIVVKVTENNEGLYTLEAYEELTLQMSTGDYHTHKYELVQLKDTDTDKVITLQDLVR